MRFNSALLVLPIINYLYKNKIIFQVTNHIFSVFTVLQNKSP